MPGVIMATECKAFDKLYQLAELEEPSITVRVQRLLMLLPTDPDVQEALDSIGQQVRSYQLVDYRLCFDFCSFNCGIVLTFETVHGILNCDYY